MATLRLRISVIQNELLWSRSCYSCFKLSRPNSLKSKSEKVRVKGKRKKAKRRLRPSLKLRKNQSTLVSLKKKEKMW